ncbi:MAG TPA: class A beta-lactamase, partial [Caulobacteraceae bacterium]|nr:class A beta-lactamase [Caulobacteraceae bacterium]
MSLDRRALLAMAPALLARPALAGAPSELAAYERDTGGRVGLFVHDLQTGRKLAWRSGERFVM